MRRPVGIVLLSLLIAVAGCAGVPGGAEGDLSRAAADAASAVSAARLGLDQHSSERTTHAHAETVVTNSLEEVLGTYGSVASLEVGSDLQAHHRDVLLGRLDAATRVLAQARTQINGLPSAQPTDVLDARLASLAEDLGAYAAGAR